MGNIIVLKEDTINKIAAGEVIERPASIVKELVENAIDANATSIIVKTQDAGKTLIAITDNGVGIKANDIENVFLRHATSKIESEEDLFSIKTLGFRGEAMASIAAISEIELKTCFEDEDMGSRILIKGGIVLEKDKIASPIGTEIRLKNLFYNTPARLKFLKSDRTENFHISDIMEKTALSNKNISFKYIANEKVIFHTPGNGDLLSTIQCLYGIKTSKMMLPLEYKNELVKLEGYIAKPELSKGNSSSIIFSINNRVINNIALKEAVKTAYKSLLMKKRYPFTILNIDINPNKIDVNVHPRKSEIKFQDDRSIFNIIYYAIKDTLDKNNLLYSESLKNGLGSFNNINSINMQQDNLSFIDSNDLISVNRSNNYGHNKVSVLEEKEEYSIMKNNKQEPYSQYENEIEGKIVIGQLFNTYIICQDEDKLYLIDQHAAQERIIYEELKIKKHKKEIQQQLLLAPLIIELSPKEKEYIGAKIELFNSLGFEIEMFDDDSIAIRQLPLIMGEPCPGSVITNLLDSIVDIKDDIKEFEEKALIQIACKSSVKANARLSFDEMVSLVKQLFITKLFYTCPHGRPTIISLNKFEIEKMFKRIL